MMRWPCLVATALALAGAMAVAGDLGRAAFDDPRHPPPWRTPGAETAKYELGQAVFNTQFVEAGTAGAGRIDGLGPLFGNAACDSCHNDGARGRGPIEPCEIPGQLVVQLAGAGADGGDPRYGRMLSPAAIHGVPPEGRVRVSFRIQAGRYGDGSRWERREPWYRLEALGYGALDARTVIRPRLAPAVFGAGLLDAIAQDAIVRGADPTDANGDGVAGSPRWVSGVAGRSVVGRFGWQATVATLRQQTAMAFLLEQGLTSSDLASDDCTIHQPACRAARDGGAPEVLPEFFDAVVTYQRLLAVPASPVYAGDGRPAALFAGAGCAACHLSSLPVRLPDGSEGVIHTYTDLLTHDLGVGLADRDVRGRPVASRWRTAPLWGIGWRREEGRALALLHDGRARSVEEAILWHEGEAERARTAFMSMDAGERAVLAEWVLRR